MPGASARAGQGRTWPPGRRGVVHLAHRGGRGPWRENTVEAFLSALGLGSDGVELDVRRGADGTLVVHHDPGIPGSGFVHELRREQLPTWVPTLTEALGACSGALVDVEIKNSPFDPGFDPDERVVLDVVRELAEFFEPGSPGEKGDEQDERRARSVTGSSTPEVMVSSFSAATLAAVRDAQSASRARESGPGLPLGLLIPPALDPHDAVETASEIGCSVVLPHFSSLSGSSGSPGSPGSSGSSGSPGPSARFVDVAHEAGLAVVSWTVNDAEDVEAALGAGVDGIVSDDLEMVPRVRRAGR